MEERAEYIKQSEPEVANIEGYFVCPDCGKILGYKAREGKALYLYVYAYPPDHCGNLEGRRVNTRILSGDVWCPCCCQWREWNTAVERPWETPIC
jgi:hypothetical protein